MTEWHFDVRKQEASEGCSNDCVPGRLLSFAGVRKEIRPRQEELGQAKCRREADFVMLRQTYSAIPSGSRLRPRTEGPCPRIASNSTQHLVFRSLANGEAVSGSSRPCGAYGSDPRRRHRRVPVIRQRETAADKARAFPGENCRRRIRQVLREGPRVYRRPKFRPGFRPIRRRDNPKRWVYPFLLFDSTSARRVRGSR